MMLHEFIRYVLKAHAKCCEITRDMLQGFMGICFKFVSPSFLDVAYGSPNCVKVVCLLLPNHTSDVLGFYGHFSTYLCFP